MSNNKKAKQPSSAHLLGQFLKQAREELQLSLRSFERLTGISNPFLLKMERGETLPRPEILRKLSDGLEVPILYLMALAGYINTNDLKEIQTFRRRKNLLVKL